MIAVFSNKKDKLKTIRTTLDSDGSIKKLQKKSGGVFPKVMSVLAAIALWLYVFQAVDYEKNVSDIPIELENFDRTLGLEIVNSFTDTIDVTLSGTKSVINDISKNDVRAVIDLRDVTSAGTYNLSVFLEAPTGVAIVGKSVEQLSVVVDKKVSQTFEIAPLLSSYTIQRPYELGEISLSASEVTLTGPETDIKAVSRVVLELELGNVKNSVKSNSAVKLLDAGGNEISSKYISIEPSVVTVDIPVYKTSSFIVHSDVIINADRFDYSVSPSVVDLKGLVDDMERSITLKTEKEAISSAGKYTLPLAVPQNLTAYAVGENGDRVEITSVTLTVTEKPIPAVPEDEANAENTGA